VAARSLKFHEEAAAEYDSAFDWYLERNPDAALKFDAEVGDALSQILRHPQRWAPGLIGTRRYLLRRFPFLVIYRERGQDTIQIIAIAHTSRRPYYWRQRI
jgi:plasmid stabilization system protein ParE